MYSLRDFGDMIADAGRFHSYAEAIAKAVRPGDIVLEIGAGPGVFGLLACRAGAKKVYAVDSEEIVYFARELAAANGLTDRMEFIQSDSRRVQLSERVNVIVSDIRGSLPLFGHAIPSIEDARQRFLAPGGVLIPQRDTLRVAVIEAEKYYSGLVTPWQNAVRGMDLSPSLSLILNWFYTAHFKSEQLLTEPQSWGVLDYSAGAPTGVTGNLSFRATRPGKAHGVCVWFDAELFSGIGYSSGPGPTPNIYGQVFLPWPEAVKVGRGHEIHLMLRADLVDDTYIWRWETKICANGTPQRDFQQSTFQGAQFSPASLHRRAASFVPTLSESGLADRWLLQVMDGKTSLQEIARSAVRRFPQIFPRWEDALHRAADLARQFSR